MLEDSRLENAVQWAARSGASYADARYVERESETVSIKDGQVEGIDRDSDRGVGVRVLHQGSWGFAASDRLTGESVVVPLFEQAIARAEAAATVQRRHVVLAPAEPQRGEYRTPVRRDPFAIPLGERVDLLRAADAILLTPTRRYAVPAWLRIARASAS